jgi:hypothetical protein
VGKLQHGLEEYQRAHPVARKSTGLTLPMKRMAPVGFLVTLNQVLQIHSSFYKYMTGDNKDIS